MQSESGRLKTTLEMVDTICHDLNQPLMAIVGNLELISMENQDNPSVIKRIGKVNDQVQRLSDMIERLRDITRI